jgi:predicted dehydrogenase
MIQYRMNAGFIPKEHWIQTDVGAGRIIGEACHVIDLFCFLTDAQPVAVSVESLHAGRDDLFPTDNFNVQISFNDGSVCALMYTALGSTKQNKERMEIFYDGKSIVMDDFVGLYGFGLPSWFNETVTSPDKGHELLINTFFQELKKVSFIPPIPFNRLFTVAELTLLIDQLACEGGGSRDIS